MHVRGAVSQLQGEPGGASTADGVAEDVTEDVASSSEDARDVGDVGDETVAFGALPCARTEALAATLATRAFAEALRRAAPYARRGAFVSDDALASRLATIASRITVVRDLHTRLVIHRRDGAATFAGAPTRRAAFFCADADRIFARRVSLVAETGSRGTEKDDASSASDDPVVPAFVMAHVLAPALADALGAGAEQSGADAGAVAAAAAALLSAPLSSGEEKNATATLRAVAETVAPETGYPYVNKCLSFAGEADSERHSMRDSDSDDEAEAFDGRADADAYADADADAREAFAPGSRVSRRDAAKLRLRPTRPLAEGETVAVAVRQPEKIKRVASPAEAAAEAAAARAASRAGGGDGEAFTAATREKTPRGRFVYARVVSATRPAGGARALASATLETSPGVRETRLASEVFTFALVSELAASRGASATTPGATKKRAVSADDESSAVGRDAFVRGGNARRDFGDEGSPDGKKGGDSARRDEDASAAGPSPAAFARAARELLAAAGAPMPSDAERMLAAHQELRADLAAAVAAAAAAARSEKETLAKAAAAANAFLCPVTQTAMADPVLAMDGHTYERAAIERWFANGRATSPVTNARLPSLALVPNHALKSARAAFEDARLSGAAREDAREDERE